MAEGQADPEVGKRLQAFGSDGVRMTRDAMNGVGIRFEDATEPQKAALLAFLFGMLTGHGIDHKMEAHEIRSLALIIFIDVLKYSHELAYSIAEELIMCCQENTPDPLLHSIVHRGLDGYSQWAHGREDILRKNLQGILDWVATGIDTAVSGSK